MRLILALCLLVILTGQSYADDKRTIIVKDVNGRAVTSTRTLESGTVVLRVRPESS